MRSEGPTKQSRPRGPFGSTKGWDCFVAPVRAGAQRAPTRGANGLRAPRSDHVRY
jgi:hypothetical protein